MSQELLSNWWFKDEFGFPMVPPPEAGMVFCKAVMVCAKGDGELADSEREWALGAAAVHNLSQMHSRSFGPTRRMTTSRPSPQRTRWWTKRGGTRSFTSRIRAARADGRLADGEVAAISGWQGSRGVGPGGQRLDRAGGSRAEPQGPAPHPGPTEGSAGLSRPLPLVVLMLAEEACIGRVDEDLAGYFARRWGVAWRRFDEVDRENR